MKTSVTMVRHIGSFEFLQRTKDGYFDANILISQWNSVKGNTRRRLDDFLKSKTTLDFIDVINSDLANGEISPMAYYIKKGKNTSNGRTKDEVWMHPYLFIDFAMWINPKFKLSVIKFVYDQLIQQRNLAGDNYLVLSSSGVKLKGYKFTEVAKAIQWIVYGKTGKNLRQTASQPQLEETNDIQTKLAFAIDMGFIKTYEQLIIEMRKMYRIKYLTSPF
jgi:hypothetical protein